MTEVQGVEEALIRPEAVAGLLDVPTSWVYAAAKDGRLPCVKAGRYVRFRRSDIDTYIAQGGTT